MSSQFPVERARTLLQRLILAYGGVPARKVHEAAKRAGLPAWAIRKARKSMEIEVRFVGFGTEGWWEWRRAEPRTWEDPTPEPSPPPVCAWPGCELPPRSKKAAYCAAHKQASLRRTKREWARKDRALLRRAIKRLGVDRVHLKASEKTGTPVPKSPSACLPERVQPAGEPVAAVASPGSRNALPPPTAPGRWMTPEELDAEVERIRGRAGVRGPRRLGPPG